MGENPLKEVVDWENGPELEDSAYFGEVVVHEELEGEEGGNVESEQLTNLKEGYLTKESRADIMFLILNLSRIILWITIPNYYFHLFKT